MSRNPRYFLELPSRECFILSQIRHAWLANTVLYFSVIDWQKADDDERESFLRQAAARLSQLGSLLSQEPDIFDPVRILEYLGSDGARIAAVQEALHARQRTPRWVLKLLHRCSRRRAICLRRLEVLHRTAQDQRAYTQFQASCRWLHGALNRLPRGPVLP